MTTPELTLEAVRSLDLLDAVATPGPWVAVSDGQVWRGPVESTRGVVKGLTKDARWLFTIASGGYRHTGNDEAASATARVDRNLIAEMRTRLPALLASARRLLEIESALSFLSGEHQLCASADDSLRMAREMGWPGIEDGCNPEESQS
jgi:hypothetical protein